MDSIKKYDSAMSSISYLEYKGGKYTIHIMIKKIFDKVVDVLMLLADKFHTTYNAVNIVVYYCLIPLFWAVLLDYKLGTFAFSLAVLSFWAGIFIFDRHFVKDCDYWFEKSVAFLEWFKKIGWNYKLSSVIICVVLPIILTVILLF